MMLSILYFLIYITQSQKKEDFYNYLPSFMLLVKTFTLH